MLYAAMKYIFMGPVLRLFFPCTVIGAEYIPDEGGAILAGNHISVADSFFAPLHLKRRVTFLAKSEYFTGKGIKGKLKKWFFAGVGQVPIDRDGASAAHNALNTGVRLLRKGKLLGIYPEGTRSPDGKLYKGKTGVARMALEAGVPVIPTVMLGTDKVNPLGTKIWRPHRITLVVGRPLDFSRYEGMAGDRLVERSMTDEIMYRLMELSGQEYVDIYATKRKAQLRRADAGERDREATDADADHAVGSNGGVGPGTVTRLPDSRAS